MSGCTRNTCQVPDCGDLSTDVAWFHWRPCRTHARLVRRWRRQPDDRRRGLAVFEHVHRCPAHGHIHFCAQHYAEHLLAGEGEPMAFGLDANDVLIYPAELGRLEWDNAPDARRAPDAG